MAFWFSFGRFLCERQECCKQMNVRLCVVRVGCCCVYMYEKIMRRCEARKSHAWSQQCDCSQFIGNKMKTIKCVVDGTLCFAVLE